MSIHSLNRRTLAVLVTFGAIVAIGSSLGLALSLLRFTGGGWASWSVGPFNCGCSILPAAGMGNSIGSWILLLASSLIIGWVVIRSVHAIVRMRREWHGHRAARTSMSPRLRDVVRHLRLVRVSETQGPSSAATLGIWKPEILISRRLAARLSRGELMAVLAHEAAHQAYHDPARLLIAALMEQSFGFIPAIRRLIKQFRQGIEQAADQASIDRLGGSYPISRALTRLMGWRFSAAATVAAFAPTTDRLDALMFPVRPQGQFFLPQLGLIIMLPLFLLGLAVKSSSAAPASNSSIMCHAPVACRFVNYSSADRSFAPCSTEPFGACQTR